MNVCSFQWNCVQFQNVKNGWHLFVNFEDSNFIHRWMDANQIHGHKTNVTYVFFRNKACENFEKRDHNNIFIVLMNFQFWKYFSTWRFVLRIQFSQIRFWRLNFESKSKYHFEQHFLCFSKHNLCFSLRQQNSFSFRSLWRI